jgi:hypothetical protein
MTEASNPVVAEGSTSAEEIKVPAELAPLIRKIRLRLYAESIWLRDPDSEGKEQGEWDLLVALPDDGDPDHHDPILGWILQQEAGVPATIRTTTLSDLDATLAGMRGGEGPASATAVRLL